MDIIKNIFNFLVWFVFLSFVGMVPLGIFGWSILIINTFIKWVTEEVLQNDYFFWEKYLGVSSSEEFGIPFWIKLMLIGFLFSVLILKLQKKYKIELVKLTEEERKLIEKDSSLNWKNFKIWE